MKVHSSEWLPYGMWTAEQLDDHSDPAAENVSGLMVAMFSASLIGRVALAGI